MATLYTIGHSTRTLEEFISVLQAHGIHRVVDIRSYPASRRMPWFQGPQRPPFMTEAEALQHEALEATLPHAGIAYLWMPSLGGRRKKIRDDSPNLGLTCASFRNYADYMLTPEFRLAIGELVTLATQERTAIMCAERQVYFHCHRMLVADYLAAHGHTVLHIESAAPARPHRMTAGARLEGDGLIYGADLLFA